MGTANVDSRRVLVVEDNEDVAAALTFGIEHHGHQVRRARDGLSALEAASQFRPHIALIDLYLPVIDGWQLARMLGDFEVFQRPRLIALSGHAGPPTVCAPYSPGSSAIS